MSRTLIWYILRDLLRIFVLTAGALAGIMSFGGLLRPLTEHGLHAAQVGRVLMYLTPAMLAYSLPIAALFAATMVYGRLSADNELTAIRAGGISHLSIAIPALALGLTVAALSLLLLWFIVPVFTLKVDQVVYSNIARLVANRIQSTHEIRLGQITVFADAAELPTGQTARRSEQRVILRGPTIVTYEPPREPHGLRVAKEFWTARRATVFIRQPSVDEPELSVEAVLEDGAKIPRRFEGSVQAGVQTALFGPIVLPSPIRENTKFMDIHRLRRLYENPDRSRKIRTMVRELARQQQQVRFLEGVRQTLGGTGVCTMDSGSDVYTFRADTADIQLRSGELILSALPGVNGGKLHFEQRRGESTILKADASQIVLRVEPHNDVGRIAVNPELRDALVYSGDSATPRGSFLAHTFYVAMPRPVQRVYTEASAADYLAASSPPTEGQHRLARELVVLGNEILAEVNARGAFAASCLILVVIGCALGMMFRSGNFLSAFAVSIVPAILSIMLIITGQHTCENVPMSNYASHSLGLGLALIWSGNAAVLVLAIALMWRLQRQ